MSPNPETPTAATALRLAYDIVKAPCSAAETQRAEVLLGIAREIREEQQYRATRSMLGATVSPLRTKPDHLHVAAPPADTAKLEELAKRFGQASPADAATRLDSAMGQAMRLDAEQAVAALRETTVVGWPDAVTQVVPANDLTTTQRIPIVWEVGDKAQCRHCHTPIELVEAVTTGFKADNVNVWRHKYSGQAVCAAPLLGQGDNEVPSAHTFAEPEPR